MKSPALGPLMHLLFRCRALPHGGVSDADLLDRFGHQGDQEAFAVLVQRHGPMVLALCRRLLRDEHAASDAFQATFLILVRKCLALRRPNQLGPWLYGVAYRTALRLRHTAGRWQPLPPELDAPTGAMTDPLDRLAWEETRAILDEEIHRLPARYQLPVVLCYLQGQSYTEAAQTLGWPAGTVSARLARAREQLRQRLSRRGLCLSASLLGGLLSQDGLRAAVPRGLLSITVTAGASVLGGSPGLAGIVSQEVLSLSEGVLRAMWTTKLKMTLLTAVLAVGLLGTGVGGIAWRSGGLMAQPPALEVPSAKQDNLPVKPQEGGSIEDVERQIKMLEKQLQAKKALLQQRRNQPALAEIEAALKKLRQATADDPRGREAVREFATAFDKLKERLHATQATPKDPREKGARFRRPLKGAGGGRILGEPIVEGVVLQVDLEAKTALLSIGKNDGVKKGDVYRTYQPNRLNPDQTGWLKVTEVSGRWSFATITQNYASTAPLQAKDIIQRDGKPEPKPKGGGN